MITIKRYNIVQKQIWDDFVQNAKNKAFMLMRDYMEYHADRFIDHSLLLYADDELVALLPASIHGTELRSHGGLTYGGLICGYTIKQHIVNDCFLAIKAYMYDNNIKRLIYKPMPQIYHRYPTQEDLYALWLNNAKIIKRDVSTTIEFIDCLIKLPKGRKAQIARAKRVGIEVGESNDFKKFIDLENQVLSRYHQTKAVHTASELELLHSCYPNNIKLLVAKYNDEIVAGALIFVYDNIVHVQYMASSEFGRANGGLDLVIVTIIEQYRLEKRYLDFGISTEDGGRLLNNGLISQKESFGGRSVVYDCYELTI